MSKKEMKETISQWQRSDLYENQENSQFYNQTWKHKNNDK
jgi:hypothetical protein